MPFEARRRMLADLRVLIPPILTERLHPATARLLVVWAVLASYWYVARLGETITGTQFGIRRMADIPGILFRGFNPGASRPLQW